MKRKPYPKPCSKCGKIIKKPYHNFVLCRICYNKKYFNERITIPSFGNKNIVTKQTRWAYVNGCKDEIVKSDFVKKEKERILKDCIRNPKRYLK